MYRNKVEREKKKAMLEKNWNEWSEKKWRAAIEIWSLSDEHRNAERKMERLRSQMAIMEDALAEINEQLEIIAAVEKEVEYERV